MKKLYPIIVTLIFLLVYISNYIRDSNTLTHFYFLFIILNLFYYLKTNLIVKELMFFFLYSLLLYLFLYQDMLLNKEFYFILNCIFVAGASILYFSIKNKTKIFCLFFITLIISQFYKDSNNSFYSLYFGSFVLISLVVSYLLINRKNTYKLIIEKDSDNIHENFILLSLSIFIPVSLKSELVSFIIPNLIIIVAFFLIALSNKYLFFKFYKIVFFIIVFIGSLLFSYILLGVIFVTLLVLVSIEYINYKKIISSKVTLFLRNKIRKLLKNFLIIEKEKYFLILLMFFLLIIKISYSGKG